MECGVSSSVDPCSIRLPPRLACAISCSLERDIYFLDQGPICPCCNMPRRDSNRASCSLANVVMTNAHSDENPFDGWRTEIRAFCDDVRQQLSTIRDEIETNKRESAIVAVQVVQNETPIETSASVPEATLSNASPEGIITAQDSSPRVTNGTPSDAAEANPSNDTTEDRLQSVRRQLQAMLNSADHS